MKKKYFKRSLLRNSLTKIELTVETFWTCAYHWHYQPNVEPSLEIRTAPQPRPCICPKEKREKLQQIENIKI